MEEMLLINPRGRNGRFTKRRRRVNARKRRVTARKRRRNPIAAIAANPRRRRRRNPIAAIAMNPRRKRRRNPIALMNPRRRRVRARRRNPRMTAMSFKPRAILNALVPASIGAGGALVLDIAMGYVPLPANFQTPLWRNLARLGGALAIGYASSFVLGREKAKQVTLGALTVTAYSVIRDAVKTQFPNLGLSGAEQYDYSDLRIGYVNPAAMVTNGVGAYMPSSMVAPVPGVGAYMRGSLDNVNALGGVSADGL